jgi:hypothetical protein
MQQCPSPNPQPDAANCSAQVNFVARKIEATPMTPYSNNPN